jgi:DNA-binding MarR family transcriptional regulator
MSLTPSFSIRVKRLVRLSLNQKRILAFLKKHGSLTALQLAEKVYEKKLVYKYLSGCPEYSSVRRSLLSLERKGLVKRSGGAIVWSRTESK